MPTVSPDLVEFCFDFTAQKEEKTKRPKMWGFFDNIAYSNLCHDRIFAECRPSFSRFVSPKQRRHPDFPFLTSYFSHVFKFILTEIFYPFLSKPTFFVVVCNVRHNFHSFFYCATEFVFSLNHICHIWINKMNEHRKSEIANEKRKKENCRVGSFYGIWKGRKSDQKRWIENCSG